MATEYFYSGSEVIAEKQGSAWTDYIFFGDQRIAKQTGSTGATVTYLHADHLGSTRVCTDANGNPNGTCDYEPFGEIQPGSTCSVPTNYRFAGMYWDAEMGGHGQYHTRFRQYDPAQGRWMGVDPVAGSADDPQSLNGYAYVRNDPVNLTDPNGLCIVRRVCYETADGPYVCHYEEALCVDGIGDWMERLPPDDPNPPKPPRQEEQRKQEQSCIPRNQLNRAERALLNALSFWAKLSGVSYFAGGALTRTPSFLFNRGGVTYGVSRAYIADAQGNQAIVSSIIVQASVTTRGGAASAVVQIGGATYSNVEGSMGPSLGGDIQVTARGPLVLGFGGNWNPAGIATAASFGVGFGSRGSVGYTVTIGYLLRKVCPG